MEKVKLSNVEDSLIKLLSNTLDDYNKQQVVLQHEEICELYVLAKKHQVHTILVEEVKNLENSEKIYTKWFNESAYMAVFLGSKFEELKNLFHELNVQKIMVVQYKGVMLRHLYKYPELRLMGDIDLLVKTEDYEKCKEVFQRCGYTETERDHRVGCFGHKYLIPIELHTYISYSERDDGFSFLDDIVWQYVEKITLNNEEIFTFAPEFHLAYLILHAYIHYTGSGVGIRQLYDIVVFLKKYQDDINWYLFWGIISQTKKENFASIVFLTIEKYFNFILGKDFYPYILEVKEVYIEYFIKELISGSVFRNNDIENAIETRLLRHVDKTNRTTIIRNFFTRVLFPNKKLLGPRYNYAIKHSALLPIAWFHRIITAIFCKEENTKLLYDSFKNLLFSKQRKDFLISIGIMNNQSPKR